MEKTRFGISVKLLSVLLAILISVSLFPVIAIAEDENPVDTPATDLDETRQGAAFEITNRR